MIWEALTGMAVVVFSFLAGWIIGHTDSREVHELEIISLKKVIHRCRRYLLGCEDDEIDELLLAFEEALNAK